MTAFTRNEAANVLLSMAGPSVLRSEPAPQAPKFKMAPKSPLPTIPKLTTADTRAVVAAAFAKCPSKALRTTVIAKRLTVGNDRKKKNLTSPDFGVSHAPPGWPSAIRVPRDILKTPLTKEMAAVLEFEFTDKKNCYPTYTRIRELSDKTGLLAIETSMWFKFRRCAKNAQARIAATRRADTEKKKAAPLK